MPIPLVNGNENVKDLHPVFYKRVEALCADPRLRGLLKVDSGVRTYAEQVYLYNGYISGRPGFNLAANPNQTIGAAYDCKSARGSWHMQQPNGYGYAVDLNFSALPYELKMQLEHIAAEYKLIRTVPSEQWHYQMTWNDWTWTPASTKEWDEMATKKEIQDAVREVIKAELGGTNARINSVADDVDEVRRELQGPTSSRQGRTIREALGALTNKFGV